MTWSLYTDAGLLNPSFDSGALSPWVSTGAGYLVHTGAYGPIPANRVTNSSAYGLVNSGGGNSGHHVYQDIDLTTLTSSSEIDAGNLRLEGGFDLVAGEASYDNAKLEVKILDGSQLEIATAYNSGWYTNTAWSTHSFSDYVVPSGGRYVRMEIYLWEDTFDVGSADNGFLRYSTFSGGGGGPTYEAAFKVQHISDDIGNSGGTNTSFTAVSSLENAIELANNNRKVHAGDNGSSGNLEGDDLAGGRALTALDTLTYYRESGSKAANMRFETSIWEYVGDPGGDNEFIVRGRYAVDLNGSTNSVTQALTGVVNANDCIPFITGIMNNATSDDADSATIVAYLEDASTLRVQKGSQANNVRAYIAVVEFTGSNWTVLHGDSGNFSADTGTIILRDGSDGSGTATDVSSWSEALIFGHFRGENNASNVDDSISDLWPVYDPGADLQSVDWAFNANHASAGGTNRCFVHVLTNPDMVVTRFQSTSNTAGETTINISSAGITSTEEALIVGSSTSSGTGTAYGRGWRNYYLKSTTEAAHWCHRSGNTMSHEIQIAVLPQDEVVSGGGFNPCWAMGINTIL